MEPERAEVGGPGHHRQLGRAHLFRGASAGKRDLDRFDEIRGAFRHALGIEGVAGVVGAGRQLCAVENAVPPTLERGRTISQRPHDPVIHRQEVLDDVELGQPLLGEIHLGRAGDPHVAAGHLEFDRRDGRACHGQNVPGTAVGRSRPSRMFDVN